MALLDVLLVVLCGLITSSQGLWPEPVSFTSGASVLWAPPNLEITVACHNETYSSHDVRGQSLYVIARGFFLDLYSQLPYRSNTSATGNSQLSEQAILQASIQRSQSAIASTKLVPWKFFRRNEAFEPGLSEPKVFLGKVQIYQASVAPNLDAATFFAADESYTISITAE